MTQDDFPNIKQFMEHCREYFGKDIRPTYIQEGDKEAGTLYDYEKTAVIQEPLENLEDRKVLLAKGRLSRGKK